MSYEVVLSRKSLKFLRNLSPKDRARIKESLLKLRENPWSMQYKKLKGYPFYRIRVGDYRVIYSVDETSKTVYVIRIGRRGNVYKDL
ncbi:type II toxin-antitoxin system RelE/ParE family toxin [Thermococcus sp.]|uniref:type II toxin-antitoxin system RelE family toxin n=1 Tax=Thermococcus sp. TaxID=35749 RepID=UPI0026090F99|nr:type II toxin-antitoxin system RelE/ParE family toxin [Thermococcus sp.]